MCILLQFQLLILRQTVIFSLFTLEELTSIEIYTLLDDSVLQTSYIHWVIALYLTFFQEIDEPALIPHIAEASSIKYPYEVLFRSLQKLLMDTATSEYTPACYAT
jgi:hypothetical protein